MLTPALATSSSSGDCFAGRSNREPGHLGCAISREEGRHSSAHCTQALDSQVLRHDSCHARRAGGGEGETPRAVTAEGVVSECVASVRLCVCMHVYVCVFVCLCVCFCVCVCVCVCVS